MTSSTKMLGSTKLHLTTTSTKVLGSTKADMTTTIFPTTSEVSKITSMNTTFSTSTELDISSGEAEKSLSTARNTNKDYTYSGSLTRETSRRTSTATTATEATVSNQRIVTQASVSSRMLCICPCFQTENKWQHLISQNLTKTEILKILQDDLKVITDELTIDKRKTSAFLRRRTSAADYRTSSFTIGTVGIVIICIPLGFILISDCSRLFVKSNKN